MVNKDTESKPFAFPYVFKFQYLLNTDSYWDDHSSKQECFPVGCVPSAAVAVTGGGVSAHGGVSVQRGGLPRGVSGRHIPPVDNDRHM